MPREVTHRLQELKREIERQDEQWAEVEAQMRALSALGLDIARSVVEEINEAFGVSSRSTIVLHQPFC